LQMQVMLLTDPLNSRDTTQALALMSTDRPIGTRCRHHVTGARARVTRIFIALIISSKIIELFTNVA
jgi:hypothetical protein